jgi:hypothetical protein
VGIPYKLNLICPGHVTTRKLEDAVEEKNDEEALILWEIQLYA